MKAGRIRVVLIEDHGIVREGLRRILAQEPDIAVIGEAADGEAGLRLIARLNDADPRASPLDVLVSDLSLPGMNGLEVVSRTKAAWPTTRVLILTMHRDEEHVRGLMAAGAEGYLVKHDASKLLPEAIRAIARGEMVLSPELSGHLAGPKRPALVSTAFALSAREREVLALLAAGLTSKEIASRLGLRPKTVENHRGNILGKLGVPNTVAAITLATQRGLLRPTAPSW